MEALSDKTTGFLSKIGLFNVSYYLFNYLFETQIITYNFIQTKLETMIAKWMFFKPLGEILPKTMDIHSHRILHCISKPLGHKDATAIAEAIKRGLIVTVLHLQSKHRL